MLRFGKGVAKSSVLAERAQKGDPLRNAMGQLLQEVTGLGQKIAAQITATTHAVEPNALIIKKETDDFVREYKRLFTTASTLRPHLEAKLNELQSKGSVAFAEPIPATSLQTIVMLHLASEMPMAKRMDELNTIDKYRKEALQQVQTGLKALRERFDEVVSRLNLFCYMSECLQKEGVLPGNVMYNSRIPQVISSPFGVQKLVPQLQNKVAVQPAKVASHHVVREDPALIKEDLEKRRALLLKLREESKKEKESKI